MLCPCTGPTVGTRKPTKTANVLTPLGAALVHTRFLAQLGSALGAVSSCLFSNPLRPFFLHRMKRVFCLEARLQCNFAYPHTRAHGSNIWLNYSVQYLGLPYASGTAHRDAKYRLLEHGLVYACEVARPLVRLCPFMRPCIKCVCGTVHICASCVCAMMPDLWLPCVLRRIAFDGFLGCRRDRSSV